MFTLNAVYGTNSPSVTELATEAGQKKLDMLAKKIVAQEKLKPVPKKPENKEIDKK